MLSMLANTSLLCKEKSPLSVERFLVYPLFQFQKLLNSTSQFLYSIDCSGTDLGLHIYISSEKIERIQVRWVCRDTPAQLIMPYITWIYVITMWHVENAVRMWQHELTFSNDCNFIRKALRVHIHMNFFTCFDVQKTYCKVGYIVILVHLM
jgi:hypothetical protein